MELNVGKSDRHNRYYKCSTGELDRICASNGQYGKGNRDYPAAREFFAREFGIDMEPFQLAVNPYAHHEQVRNSFTQLEEELNGQARVRLQFVPGAFKNGEFMGLVPDNIPVRENLDWHIRYTAATVYGGDDSVLKPIDIWQHILTDLRRYVTGIDDPVKLFDIFDYMHSGEINGLHLSLALSSDLDLPWMVDNSKCMVHLIAQESGLKQAVRIYGALLREAEWRSGKSLIADEEYPLPDGEFKRLEYIRRVLHELLQGRLGGSIREGATQFTGVFSNVKVDAVDHALEELDEAAQHLRGALDDKVQAARQEYDSGISSLAEKEKGDAQLVKFFQSI